MGKRTLFVVFVIFICPGIVWAQESLQTAQALYTSASYDEALAMLERLQKQPLPSADAVELQQNRALCLLALGRTADAEEALAAVVKTAPTYGPPRRPPRRGSGQCSRTFDRSCSPASSCRSTTTRAPRRPASVRRRVEGVPASPGARGRPRSPSCRREGRAGVQGARGRVCEARRCGRKPSGARTGGAAPRRHHLRAPRTSRTRLHPCLRLERHERHAARDAASGHAALGGAGQAAPARRRARVIIAAEGVVERATLTQGMSRLSITAPRGDEELEVSPATLDGHPVATAS